MGCNLSTSSVCWECCSVCSETNESPCRKAMCPKKHGIFIPCPSPFILLCHGSLFWDVHVFWEPTALLGKETINIWCGTEGIRREKKLIGISHRSNPLIKMSHLAGPGTTTHPPKEVVYCHLCLPESVKSLQHLSTPTQLHSRSTLHTSSTCSVLQVNRKVTAGGSEVFSGMASALRRSG